VNAAIREMLTTHCKLEEVKDGLAPAACWASQGWREHGGPTLLLVCGNTPGGEAGVWGRALCINKTTLQGSMFDYIARGLGRGWAVVVADPHTDAAPHQHLIRLMEGPLAGKKQLLVVAHSYGAPCTLGMVKSVPSALQRVDALAFTDGMAWTPAGWTYKAILAEPVPSDDEITAEAEKQAQKEAQKHSDDGSKDDAASASAAAEDLSIELDAAKLKKKFEALRAIRDRRAEFAQLAPGAFAPPSEEIVAFVRRVGCNFVASPEPLGAAVELESSCTKTVSAAHESHPSTTFTATEGVFALLDEAAAAAAAAARGTTNAHDVAAAASGQAAKRQKV
jgi:hypothetical protein